MSHKTSLVELHKLLGVAGQPAYVKTASEQEAPKAVGSQGCADGANGAFPCNSPESTYLSAVKLAADRSVPGAAAIDSKITEFAGFWKISSDVDEARTKIASHLSPVALTNLDYALCQQHGDGMVRKFAAFDGATTKRASEAFYENRHRYPYQWRRDTAINLIKRAGDYSVEFDEGINDYLHKAAGFAYASQDSLDSLVAERISCVGRSNQTFSMKLAEAVGVIADSPTLRYNNDMVADVLDVVDRFDHGMKIASHYGERLSLPEESLDIPFTKLQKTASYANGQVSLQNGVTVNVHDLAKTALEAVDPALATMPLAKLASVLPTLPTPDANLLCEAAGIKKSAAAAPGSNIDILNTSLPPAVKPAPTVKPNQGAEIIGEPYQPPAAKIAQEAMMDPAMMGGMPPAQGGMPPAQGGMPPAPPAAGPGAVPGAPAPGDGMPMPGEGGAAEPAPGFEMTPGQEARPGEAAGGMDDTQQAGAASPDAVFDMPLIDGMEGQGAMDGSLDVTSDPAIVAGASPSAGGDQQGDMVSAAGIESAPETAPGMPMGAMAPAMDEQAQPPMAPQASGLPQI